MFPQGPNTVFLKHTDFSNYKRNISSSAALFFIKNVKESFCFLRMFSWGNILEYGGDSLPGFKLNFAAITIIYPSVHIICCIARPIIGKNFMRYKLLNASLIIIAGGGRRNYYYFAEKLFQSF